MKGLRVRERDREEKPRSQWGRRLGVTERESNRGSEKTRSQEKDT